MMCNLYNYNIFNYFYFNYKFISVDKQLINLNDYG